MFIGTLIDPFFNHLIRSSSAGFTEPLLTGERVESGTRSGKIQVAASSNAVKKPFNGKKEDNSMYGQKGHGKEGRHQVVGGSYDF